MSSVNGLGNGFREFNFIPASTAPTPSAPPPEENEKVQAAPETQPNKGEDTTLLIALNKVNATLGKIDELLQSCYLIPPSQPSLPTTEKAPILPNTETKLSETELLSEVLHQLSKEEQPNNAPAVLRDLEQQVREFSTRNNQMAQELKKLKDQLQERGTSPNTSDLQHDIVVLEANLEKLNAEYNVKAQRKEAMEAFQSFPNQWSHYRRIYIRLEQIFVGCKAVSSEFIETDLTGNIATAATAVKVIGKLLSLVPFIGNSLDTVVEVASSGLEKIDQIRQTNILKTMASLGTLTDIKKAAESTARQLTEKYREQLEMLPIKKPEGSLQKVNAFVLKGSSRTRAEEVADFAVSQILGALLDGAISADVPLETQFIRCIYTPPSRLDRIRQAICYKLKMSKVTTTDKKEWQLEHIYTKPGIKTPQGNCYGGTETDSELYGYRYGTDQEAIELGLSVQKKSVLEKQLPQEKAPLIGSGSRPSALPSNTNEVHELKQTIQEMKESLQFHAEKAKSNEQNIKRMEDQLRKLKPSEDEIIEDDTADGQIQRHAQRTINTSTTSLSAPLLKEAQEKSEHDQRLRLLEQTVSELGEILKPQNPSLDSPSLRTKK